MEASGTNERLIVGYVYVYVYFVLFLMFLLIV